MRKIERICDIYEDFAIELAGPAPSQQTTPPGREVRRIPLRPCDAASANVRSRRSCSRCHSENGAFPIGSCPAARSVFVTLFVPMATSWPSSASFAACVPANRCCSQNTNSHTAPKVDPTIKPFGRLYKIRPSNPGVTFGSVKNFEKDWTGRDLNPRLSTLRT